MIDVEVVHNEGFNHLLWPKVVLPKVNIFIWRLFLNRLATKDNLLRRHNLVNGDTFYSVDCGFVEDSDHLFFKMCFIWPALALDSWLVRDFIGFS